MPASAASFKAFMDSSGRRTAITPQQQTEVLEWLAESRGVDVADVDWDDVVDYLFQTLEQQVSSKKRRDQVVKWGR